MVESTLFVITRFSTKTTTWRKYWYVNNPSQNWQRHIWGCEYVLNDIFGWHCRTCFAVLVNPIPIAGSCQWMPQLRLIEWLYRGNAVSKFDTGGHTIHLKELWWTIRDL